MNKYDYLTHQELLKQHVLETTSEASLNENASPVDLKKTILGISNNIIREHMSSLSHLDYMLNEVEQYDSNDNFEAPLVLRYCDFDYTKVDYKKVLESFADKIKSKDSVNEATRDLRIESDKFNKKVKYTDGDIYSISELCGIISNNIKKTKDVFLENRNEFVKFKDYVLSDIQEASSVSEARSNSNIISFMDTGAIYLLDIHEAACMSINGQVELLRQLNNKKQIEEATNLFLKDKDLELF